MFGRTGTDNNGVEGDFEDTELIDFVLNVMRKTEGCVYFRSHMTFAGGARWARCRAAHLYPWSLNLKFSRTLASATALRLCDRTDSDAGVLLISKTRLGYPGRIVETFSFVMPFEESNMMVQPRIAIFSSHQLVDGADTCTLLDDEALCDTCFHAWKRTILTRGDLNHLVSASIDEVSTFVRLPGQLDSNLRRLAVNVISFSRLYFFMTGSTHFTSRGSQQYRALKVLELMQQIFDARNTMCAVVPRLSRYLTSTALFRGATGIDVQFYVQHVLNCGGVGLCRGDTVGRTYQRICDISYYTSNPREAITRR